MKAARRGLLALTALAFVAAGNLTQGAMERETGWWQLTFAYDVHSLRLLSAKRMPALRKQVRTPGLAGSVLQVDCDLTWLDAGDRSLLCAPARIALGIRSPFGAEEASPPMVPSEGVFVIRTQGPGAGIEPTAVRLTEAAIRPRGMESEFLARPPVFLQGLDLTFPLAIRASRESAPAAPIRVEKTRDTGPNANRLVFVVLGDGYTSAALNEGRFAEHAERLASAFEAAPPWNVYFAGTNVYRVDVASHQQGADEPPKGLYADTYFNSSFWTNGIERLLALDSTGMVRAIELADTLVGPGVWDDIFVLVNSAKYGGSGGFLSVSSAHALASEIILHEYGHSFAGLADEYELGAAAAPATDSEPNVDFEAFGPNLKWLPWVETGIPSPTPETKEYDKRVGAFEGAKGFPSGIYRPCLNCRMRTLGQDFCPVCEEVFALRFTRLVDLVDGATPDADSMQSVGRREVTFSVTPLPISPIVFEWKLNDVRIPEATGPTLTLTNAQLGAGSGVLEVKVTHPSPFIRSEVVSRTLLWRVAKDSEPLPSAAAPRVWGLYR